ncbi:MAG: arsenite methyltransferase [Sandaracinaceae bacterium]
MTERTHDEIRTEVRARYGEIARQDGAPGCGTGGCCSPAGDASLAMGYSEQDLDAVPEGANLGLGCGNPHAIASLREGQTVLDLGSGGGFDAFLAAQQVGPTGTVIGVDMTPEMVAKARANALTIGAANVDIRLGEIERLPVADDSVDVILSNCVINLSPDKGAVFDEAFRVLRPGGRLAIADIVAIAPMPEELADDVAAYTGCVAGAAEVETLKRLLADAGFEEVEVEVRNKSREILERCVPGKDVGRYVASATLEATKPVAGCCAPACCS